MIIAQLLKYILLLTSIKNSFETKEHSVDKPYCPPGQSPGDFGCVEDRSQRDVVLKLIDYDNPRDNPNVVCDEDHPFFCEIVDPFHGSSGKSKKNSIDIGLPEIDKQIERKYYALPANEKKLESIKKSDFSSKSDSFECTENGFFPDYNNHQMFYHCANSSKDGGFISHHRKCPSGLKFNTFKKKCDMYKLASNGEVLVKPSSNKKQEFKELFHCKHNGIYPDKYNASMFWYCDRNSKNGFTVTKMLCPDDELFDPERKLCVSVNVPRNVRSDSFSVQNKFKTKFTNIDEGISIDEKSSWLPP